MRVSESTTELKLSADEFVHLGQGDIAYVKAIRSEQVSALFPQAPQIQPGLDLFMLLGADGMPILLTDSKETALANASENQLQTVSLH